jgi:hypothetical protein
MVKQYFATGIYVKIKLSLKKVSLPKKVGAADD